MKISPTIILILGLAFVLANSCSKITCTQYYELPDGAICRWKSEVSNGGGATGSIEFTSCTNGREYLNPEWWKVKEVCTK